MVTSGRRQLAVRTARLADCPGIAKVAEDSGESFAIADYYFGRIPVDFEVLVAVDLSGMVLGWLEGTLNGHVADHLAHPDHPAPHAYIHAVAVARESRRQGIGRQLIEEFVRRACRAGLTWSALTPMGGEDVEERAAFFLSTGLRCIDPQDPNQGMVGELDAIAALLNSSLK
jgi:ribosomal protein S18 acetylase RimI-like enzyme